MKLRIITFLILFQLALNATEVADSEQNQKTARRAASIGVSYFQNPGQYHKFLEKYNQLIGKPEIQNSEDAIEKALAFYFKHQNGISPACNGTRVDTKITNKDWIIITDYTKPMDEDRQYIINLKTNKIYTSPAAHGYGSNQPISKCPEKYRINCDRRGSKCKIPVSFGNKHGKGETSNGFYLTAEGYRSSQGTFRSGDPLGGGINAIRMEGLQSINSNARERAVVLHRASYVNEDTVNKCSSSAGCPSIAPTIFEQIKSEVIGGALMYNHTIVERELNEPQC